MKVFSPDNCAVLEHTADGMPVGRCWFYTKGHALEADHGKDEHHECPRHKNVTEVRRRYIETGKLTPDYSL